MAVLKYWNGTAYELLPFASISSGAAYNRTISTISESTTAGAAADTDYIYICTALLTLTLPTAVSNKNIYTVKRTGTGNVTVNTTSSQTIDGASSYILDSQWQSVDLLSDNSNWVII